MERTLEGSSDSLLGRVVAGRYEVVRKLGQGGMGAVYAALQRPLGRTVALKVLLSELTADPVATARFEKEALAVSRLAHPNIVTLFDFGRTEEGLSYLVMEFLEGTTLRVLMQGEGPLSPGRTVRVMTHTARALAEAHRLDTIHRDLKPDNVMLVPVTGESDFAKVLDFGVAKLKKGMGVESHETLTGKQVLLGTPRYMSPEQVNGITDDPRSDLYALGVMAFEMLAGRAPFEAPTPVKVLLKHLQEPPPSLLEVNPACRASPALQALVSLLLHKDPAQRVPSAQRLLELLEDLPEYTGPRQRLTTVANVPMARVDVPPAVTPSTPTLTHGVPVASVLAAAADPVAVPDTAPDAPGSMTPVPAEPPAETHDTDEQAVPAVRAMRAVRADTRDVESVFTHTAIPTARPPPVEDPAALANAATPAAGVQTVYVARPGREGARGAAGSLGPGVWVGGAVLVLGAGALVGAFWRRELPVAEAAQAVEKPAPAGPVADAAVGAGAAAVNPAPPLERDAAGTGGGPTAPAAPAAVNIQPPVTAPGATGTPPGDAPAVPVAAVPLLTFTVTSQPAGAQVLEGAALLGRTPLEVDFPSDGRQHDLRVRMAGYREAVRTLHADHSRSVAVRLQPLPGGVGANPRRGSGSAAPKADGRDAARLPGK